jgi:hypothetical protein
MANQWGEAVCENSGYFAEAKQFSPRHGTGEISPQETTQTPKNNQLCSEANRTGPKMDSKEVRYLGSPILMNRVTSANFLSDVIHER